MNTNLCMLDVAKATGIAHLIKCSNVLDTDDPAVTEFNAKHADMLALAQRLTKRLMQDLLDITMLSIDAIVAAPTIVIATDNPVVAKYMITCGIRADWRPDIANCPQFAYLDPVQLAKRPYALLMWQYSNDGSTRQGAYVATL